jgi:hypothetical protein
MNFPRQQRHVAAALCQGPTIHKSRVPLRSNSMTDPVNQSLSPSPEMQAQLQECPDEVREYVAALETEIIRLRKRDARLEVRYISVGAQNEELKNELRKKVDYSTLPDELLQVLLDYGKKLEHPSNP